MPLNLHQNCQAQLRESLTEQLANASVRNGMFLSDITSMYLFLAQSPLPTTGKIHDRILKLIGESPFVDFISGTLARELFETQEYQTEESPKPLSSLPAYEDLSAVSNRLVADFNSLPWLYTITAALPLAFSKLFCSHIKHLKLSENISISYCDESFSKTYPFTSGIQKRDQSISGGPLISLLMNRNKTWDEERAYIQIKVEGFIGKYTTTEPLIDAIGILRAFYGLGLALRLFKPSNSYQTYPQQEKIYIHRNIDNAWVIEEAHHLELRHSDTIRDLKLHDLDGALDTEEKKTEWMKRQLSAIGAIFRAQERASNLQLGAQWLLDSHCGDDELLQFVQAAVVVEILLGDKAASDQTGLGELLANRCAYLIATSHEQRNELLQDFRNIYQVRSKIVHRGKSRFMMGERTLFNKLRWMCRRIIQEEVDLLKRDDTSRSA